MLTDEWSDAVYCDCKICHGCHTLCGCACMWFCNCTNEKRRLINKMKTTLSLKHGEEHASVDLCVDCALDLDRACEDCRSCIAAARSRLGLPNLCGIVTGKIDQSSSEGADGEVMQESWDEDTDGDDSDCKSYDACSLMKEPSGACLESSAAQKDSVRPSGKPCREACNCGCGLQRRNCPTSTPEAFCKNKTHRRAPISRIGVR